MALLGALLLARGQAATAEEPAAAGAAVPKFAHLLPGKQIVGRQVLRGGKPIGKIADLALDVETEQVGLVIVAPTATDGKAADDRYLAIPAAILDLSGSDAVVHKSVTDAMVAAARRFSLKTTRINRQWAGEEYALYRRDPYWAAYRERHRKAYPDRKFDEVAPELTLYSALLKLPVTDLTGRKIGTIVDLAFDTAEASVAYAAFDASADEQGLRAIPLGAFETARAGKAWQIRLEEPSIVKFPAFAADSAWPTQIERGWVEYVALRYGRGGVQIDPPGKPGNR
jgi:sporulation protein YlmC with PRC-barrel domain